jgi:hypothetical protein
LSAFVPLANVLKGYAGGWQAVFAVAAIMNFLVVALALFVVRPMRLSISASESKENGAVGQAAEQRHLLVDFVKGHRDRLRKPPRSKGGALRCAICFSDNTKGRC